MARIEWVKHRLENWALWKDREGRGGLGYATSSVLLAEAIDRYREAVLPIDDVDASVTNTAVESLRNGKSHLYMTLQLIYVAGVGVRESARRMGKAESTIKANLDQADHALSQWFGERSAKKPEKIGNSLST
jgi:hypothetical protein